MDAESTENQHASVNLRIKGAEATLAKQAAEVLSDVFDFPFRKGIPLALLNVRAQVG